MKQKISFLPQSPFTNFCALYLSYLACIFIYEAFLTIKAGSLNKEEQNPDSKEIHSIKNNEKLDKFPSIGKKISKENKINFNRIGWLICGFYSFCLCLKFVNFDYITREFFQYIEIKDLDIFQQYIPFLHLLLEIIFIDLSIPLASIFLTFFTLSLIKEKKFRYFYWIFLFLLVAYFIHFYNYENNNDEINEENEYIKNDGYDSYGKIHEEANNEQIKNSFSKNQLNENTQNNDDSNTFTALDILEGFFEVFFEILGVLLDVLL